MVDNDSATGIEGRGYRFQRWCELIVSLREGIYRRYASVIVLFGGKCCWSRR